MAQSPRMKVWCFGTLQAVLFALLGLIAGILYSFGGFIIDALVSGGVITSTETSGLGYGTALAFLALIGMPALFAVTGFVAGVVEAFLFNLFARWLGAVDLDLQRGA